MFRREWTNKGKEMTKVIVIDDEEDIRIVLKEIFVRAGFEVEVASDGNEGMDLLREHGADLVVTDIIMPGSDGVETAYSIRMEFPKTKIIVMSGGGNAASLGYEPAAITTNAYLASAAAIGADLTLTKPFDREELIKAAKELTSH
jgi:CheY-like chemotaxis protein